ncbi:hypothetical protein PI124_g9002 [Phytophthora idaei]|nr:hypothetical protein PI125_g9748 [Phytophthora idaei]KAG3155915.1 hypothetical protein PI126_g8981 [Phytophthora idaei]KAG3246273.1 hypothetical protein PI124_g9002 [Phytophthora idaei]
MAKSDEAVDARREPAAIREPRTDATVTHEALHYDYTAAHNAGEVAQEKPRDAGPESRDHHPPTTTAAVPVSLRMAMIGAIEAVVIDAAVKVVTGTAAWQTTRVAMMKKQETLQQDGLPVGDAVTGVAIMGTVDMNIVMSTAITTNTKPNQSANGAGIASRILSCRRVLLRRKYQSLRESTAWT